MSGAKRDRPELAKMIEHLRDEDTLVVTRLDRLARSTRDLGIAESLEEMNQRQLLGTAPFARNVWVWVFADRARRAARDQLKTFNAVDVSVGFC